MTLILKEAHPSFDTITYETVSTAGKTLQKDPRFLEMPEIQGLKFSKNFIGSFLRANGFREHHLSESKSEIALAPELDYSDSSTMMTIQL